MDDRARITVGFIIFIYVLQPWERYEFIFPPAMGKIVGQIEPYTLGRQPVQEKENTEFRRAWRELCSVGYETPRLLWRYYDHKRIRDHEILFEMHLKKCYKLFFLSRHNTMTINSLKESKQNFLYCKISLFFNCKKISCFPHLKLLKWLLSNFKIKNCLLFLLCRLV